MDTHSIDTVNPETTGGIHQISRNKLEFHQISEKYCWMIDNNSRISEEAMEFLFRNKLLILYGVIYRGLERILRGSYHFR